MLFYEVRCLVPFRLYFYNAIAFPAVFFIRKLRVDGVRLRFEVVRGWWFISKVILTVVFTGEVGAVRGGWYSHNITMTCIFFGKGHEYK